MRIENNEQDPAQSLKYSIRGVQSDMNPKITANFLVQEDGDVVIGITDTRKGIILDWEVCTVGTHFPGMAQELREAIKNIVKKYQEENKKI